MTPDVVPDPAATGGCALPTSDEARGATEGYVVGPLLPAGTQLATTEWDSGGPYCAPYRTVGEGDRLHGLAPDPRPLDVWPALTLDR